MNWKIFKKNNQVGVAMTADDIKPGDILEAEIYNNNTSVVIINCQHVSDYFIYADICINDKIESYKIIRDVKQDD